MNLRIIYFRIFPVSTFHFVVFRHFFKNQANVRIVFFKIYTENSRPNEVINVYNLKFIWNRDG